MGIIQKNGFWGTVISYIGVAMGFVGSVLLLPRLLTPDQVGLTNTMLVVAVILSQLSALGGSQIVIRFFPFFYDEEKGKYNGIFTLTFLISLAGVVLFSLLYIVFKDAVVEYYRAKSPLFVKYCMLVIPISVSMVFYNLLSAWLRSLYKVIAATFYIEVVLKLFPILAVIVYALGYISFDALIWCYAFGFSIPAICLLVHCARLGMLTTKIKITPQIKTYVRPAIAYGIFCLFAGFGGTLVTQIDSVMIGGMIGLAQVAVYNIAAHFISVLHMPYRALTTISSPLVARYWKDGDMGAMQSLYTKFTLNILIITLWMFLLVWVNIDSVYKLMPPFYATGKWVILILFVGRLVDVSTGLNGTILTMSRHYRWDLYTAAGLVLMAIGANMIFIPMWGIEGSAFATALSIVLINVVKLAVVYKVYRLQPFSRPMGSVMAISLAAWGVTALIPYVGSWTGDVAVRSVLVCLLFPLPVYAMKLSPDFNSMVDGVVKKALALVGR